MARKEQTYYDRHRNHSAKKGSGRRFNVLDYIVFVVTVLVIAGVILSWASRWINPSTYGVMAALGLVMPLLFVVNFLCLLYWVIRWKRVALAPLAVLLLFSWAVTMYFKPNFTRTYSNSPRDRSLVTVMSYNIHGGMMKHNNKMSNVDKIISTVDSLRPGILCIQEFFILPLPKKFRLQFEDALSYLTYNRVHYNSSQGEEYASGTAIYSRYPIARSGLSEFEGTNRSMLWADIAVAGDTVRVFNAHLQTTSIDPTDEEYIVNMKFVGDSIPTSKFRKMVSGLRDNFVIRAAQADTLARHIELSPYPVIVCGDFNDPPVSYAYRRISKGLKDSFREAGSGYGYTFRGFFNLLRIDYVLHSKGIECVEYSSPDFDYSDHNPVVSRLKL
jgi:endonuclease/exonuclease/phosphatase family metal-dependent hydrolase